MKSLNTATVALIAALFCLSHASAAAAGEDDHRTELLDALGLIDTPHTLALFETIGVDESGAELRAAALDAELDRHRRTRAVNALGFYPNLENLNLLEALANDADQDQEVRVSAIFTLSLSAQTSAHARVDVTLQNLARTDNSEIQAAIVRAAVRVGTERGTLLLNAIEQAGPADVYISELIQMVRAQHLAH